MPASGPRVICVRFPPHFQFAGPDAAAALSRRFLREGSLPDGRNAPFVGIDPSLMIFHNCHAMTKAFKELEAEGIKLTPELAAAFSPYRTHHANRFGKYELRERDLEPIDYGVTFQM